MQLCIIHVVHNHHSKNLKYKEDVRIYIAIVFIIGTYSYIFIDSRHTDGEKNASDEGDDAAKNAGRERAFVEALERFPTLEDHQVLRDDEHDHERHQSRRREEHEHAEEIVVVHLELLKMEWNVPM